MSRAEELYRTLAPAVLGYFRSQGAPDPEDLLGETFLQVARDVAAVEGDDDEVRRWVFTVARHRLIDAGRRRRRRPRLAADAVPERAAPEATEPIDPSLLAALARLPDRQREVVVLRFVADLSTESVAHVVGRSVGAVKALQHRALERLAAELGRE